LIILLYLLQKSKGISGSFKHHKSPNTIKFLNLATSNSLIIRVLFTSKNDNIAGINIDSTFTIMYRGVPVGWGVVRGFYQAGHSVKNVQTTVAVDPANLIAHKIKLSKIGYNRPKIDVPYQ
ncbi:hypothetical protein R6Q59_003364, partial [Mikania micrantha]